ncbi:MAG: hypothetical protein QOJ20_4266 [Mycobacterium sp.]|nr:hypothetical protein [Mycobacterium sp.]
MARPDQCVAGTQEAGRLELADCPQRPQRDHPLEEEAGVEGGAYFLDVGTRDSGWTSERWDEVGRAYLDLDEHDDVGTGADTRGPALLIIDRQPGLWRVRQILDDPAGDHDRGFDVEVDLEASDEEGAAVLRLIDAGRKD